MSNESNTNNAKFNPNPFHSINTFYLGGFKAFKDTQEIPIRPITLVFGPNSSGKSSLIQGLEYALAKAGEADPESWTSDNVNKHSKVITTGFSFNIKCVKMPDSNSDDFEVYKGRSNHEPEYGRLFTSAGSNAISRYEKNPKNYSVYRDAIKIMQNNEWYLNLSDIDFGGNGYENNPNISSIEYVYDKCMPLNIEIDWYIKSIESEYFNLLLDKIKKLFSKIGMSKKSINEYISHIIIELHSLGLSFNKSSGRLSIEDKFNYDSVWFNKCLNQVFKHEDELITWLENLAVEFNARNYKQVIREMGSYSGIPYYTNLFEEMVINDFEMSRAANKQIKNIDGIYNDIKAKESENVSVMYGYNKYIKCRLVYSAVLAILSDINIRYIDTFGSLTRAQSPLIKYISSQRKILNNNGDVLGEWHGLINRSNNRNEINKRLIELTKYFSLSHPVELYTKSQVEQILAGKIDLDSTKPSLDAKLRIQDSRVSDGAFYPQNVGFGIQKLIPVIAATVYSPDDNFSITTNHDVIAIEEPEMHLHPKLQSDLGDMFIDNVVNNSEKIFILETHSENMLQRILRRVREGRISCEAVSILYVHPGTNENGARVERLEIDADGEFKNRWPEGFFDPRELDILS